MVLKFCAGFFSSEASEASEASSATSGSSSLTSFASNSDVLATKREGSLQKQVLSEILLDVRDAKWEKEFRVHFDGSIATGLGFQSLESAATSLRFGRRNSTSSFKVAATAATKSEESPTQGDYECVVREIVPDGLAAEHNARCQSLGDYSRLITPGLRVRKVNSDDVAGVAYDQVLQKCVLASIVIRVAAMCVRLHDCFLPLLQTARCDAIVLHHLRGRTLETRLGVRSNAARSASQLPSAREHQRHRNRAECDPDTVAHTPQQQHRPPIHA